MSNEIASVALDLGLECEKLEEFTTSMIPLFLYTEYSKKLGVGEDKQIYVNSSINDHKFFVHELRPEKEFAGFEGAIGIRKDTFEYTYFVLWSEIPLGGEHVDPDPVLVITGGPYKTGVWCAGSGNEMRYETIVKLEKISLKNQSLINLVADIIKRASELANDPRCKRPVYDENKPPIMRP